MTNSKAILTDTAYRAMFIFLRDYHLRDGEQSNGLAVLLGGMALAADGISADPAMVEFFHDAIVQAEKDSFGRFD